MKYFKKRVALGGSSINTWWSDRSHLLERGRDDYLHFHRNREIQKHIHFHLIRKYKRRGRDDFLHFHSNTNTQKFPSLSQKYKIRARDDYHHFHRNIKIQKYLHFHLKRKYKKRQRWLLPLSQKYENAKMQKRGRDNFLHFHRNMKTQKKRQRWPPPLSQKYENMKTQKRGKDDYRVIIKECGLQFFSDGPKKFKKCKNPMIFRELI